MLAQIYADVPRRRRYSAALAALAQVGLDHRADALPTALSGGERQRVAIARALVNHPSLLLCDEPTGNLDSVTTGELSGLLAALHREGATLLVITHNPAVAERAQRRVTIRDGMLAEQAGTAGAAPGGGSPAGGPGAPACRRLACAGRPRRPGCPCATWAVRRWPGCSSARVAPP